MIRLSTDNAIYIETALVYLDDRSLAVMKLSSSGVDSLVVFSSH